MFALHAMLVEFQSMISIFISDLEKGSAITKGKKYGSAKELKIMRLSLSKMSCEGETSIRLMHFALLISKLGKDGGMVQNGALSSNPPSIAHTYGKEERREDQDFAKPALGITYTTLEAVMYG